MALTTDKTIKLKLSEILYDIDNKTSIAGEALRGADNHKAASQMQTSADEWSRNQVMRSVTNAYTNLRTKLSEYLSIADGTEDNWQISPDTVWLTFALSLPLNFNFDSVSALRMALHRYIVDYAIGDWYMLTNKGDASAYYTLAESDLAGVDDALHKRVRPKRESYGLDGLPFYTVPGQITLEI